MVHWWRIPYTLLKSPWKFIYKVNCYMSQQFHYIGNNCPLPRIAIDQPKGDASATMGDAKKDASMGDGNMACHLEQSQYIYIYIYISFLGFQNSCEKANFHTTSLLCQIWRIRTQSCKNRYVRIWGCLRSFLFMQLVLFTCIDSCW